jgi:hypothetical protein
MPKGWHSRYCREAVVMRSIRSHLPLRWVLPVLVAGGALAAPAAAAVVPVLGDIRAGQHAAFDRVVLAFDGRVPTWTARYVKTVRADGTGKPVSLRGSGALELVLTPAQAHADDGSATVSDRLTPNLPALRDIRLAGDFEGYVTIGIGVAKKDTPFRVLKLTGPDRIVVDVAHAGQDPFGAGPKQLTLDHGQGKVGSKVTVEGSGCASPGAASTQLVFQGGTSGTTGAVDLGTFPIDGDGHLKATVTIPARLDQLQGVGGGPTRAGTYNFVTLPPACTGSFTVAGEQSAPTTTVGEAQSTPPPAAGEEPADAKRAGSSNWVWLALLGAAGLAALGGVLLLNRHGGPAGQDGP